MQAGAEPLASSYRDPSGFVFRHNKVLYRQVNKVFSQDFDYFLESGFYHYLIEHQLLVPHQAVNRNFNNDPSWHATLQPEELKVVTYPYEWCFSMLQDAALLTLQIAKSALSYGLMLKDATPFNIQFYQGKLLFIDTLSFERLDEQKPWIAYRQFCENFLAPLALMHFLQTPLHPLQLAYPDGIPLPLVKKLLPWKSRFHLGCYLHLHLHAGYSNNKEKGKDQRVVFSKAKQLRIFEHLEQTVKSFRLQYKDVWSDYYSEANQRLNYVPPKKEIIRNWVAQRPQIRSAIDLGANEGLFSEMLATAGIDTISVDFDHYSINRLYLKIKEEKQSRLLPLVMDLSHPSPAIGVNNQERDALTERVQTDLVIALAVIHHLAIGKNISFGLIASFFSRMGPLLIIEYVPRTDEKITQMLSQKKDIYQWYTEENFIASFSKFYQILDVKEIASSGRKLYLMQQYEQTGK